MEQPAHNEMKPGLRRAIYKIKKIAPSNFRLFVVYCKALATVAAMAMFFQVAVTAAMLLAKTSFLDSSPFYWLLLMVLIYGIWAMGHFLTAKLWPRMDELRKNKRRLYAAHPRADHRPREATRR